MIKIQRRSTEKARKAAEVLRVAKERGTTYNQPEVNEALLEMFHGKCYICENRDVISYHIEHRVSHHNHDDLKYDWKNLYLSCAHCNMIKGTRFDDILDCTVSDIERIIKFQIQGSWGNNERFQFIPLKKTREAEKTAELLQEVHYSDTTPKLAMASANLRRMIRREIADFRRYIRYYNRAEGEDKEDYLCLIRQELEEDSAFTAFKRWIIWENEIDTYHKKHYNVSQK